MARIISIAIVGAIAVAAFLLVPTLIPKAAQPQVETTPPYPSGTLAWTEPQWELTHQFADNVGHGQWTLTKANTEVSGIGLYAPHEVKVWDAAMDAGNTWNLQGVYTINITVKTTYTNAGAGGSNAEVISVWNSGLIEFTGNQGAYGLLKINQTPIFLPKTTNYEFDYHAEFSATCVFKSGDYTESNIAVGSLNFKW